jgi:hypothetical protein
LFARDAESPAFVVRGEEKAKCSKQSGKVSLFLRRPQMEKIKITLPKPSGKTDQAAVSKLQARVVVKTREDVAREDAALSLCPGRC